MWAESKLVVQLNVANMERCLTCAGVIIDPDVARVADAHEGARGVDTHGVLTTVVFPLGALINICTGERNKNTFKSTTLRKAESFFFFFLHKSLRGVVKH